MKRTVLILILLGSSLSVFSQDRPLTQAEFVKMLYALETNPSSKTDIVDALRIPDG